jgi:hypothetical protein
MRSSMTGESKLIFHKVFQKNGIVILNESELETNFMIRNVHTLHPLSRKVTNVIAMVYTRSVLDIRVLDILLKFNAIKSNKFMIINQLVMQALVTEHTNVQVADLLTRETNMVTMIGVEVDGVERGNIM